MEAMSMVASTEEVRGSSATVIEPVKPVKVPRTFDTIRWRTVKETSEWAGSMFQLPAVSRGVTVVEDVDIGRTSGGRRFNCSACPTTVDGSTIPRRGEGARDDTSARGHGAR